MSDSHAAQRTGLSAVWVFGIQQLRNVPSAHIAENPLLYVAAVNLVNFKIIIMATKIKWKKQKPIGNVKASWEGSVIGTGERDIVSLVEIRVFKRGEFVLPVNWFPRNKDTGMCQTTKSLSSAKAKCQKWWNSFVLKNG